jgi:bifunctional non-homologous end joining protein LigD
VLGCYIFSELDFQHVPRRQAFDLTVGQAWSVATRRAPSAIRPSPAFPAGREAASGAQWVHEIKLDGYRMAARIDNGRAQLLTRTGLDWTDKYPSVVEALPNRIKP